MLTYDFNVCGAFTNIFSGTNRAIGWVCLCVDKDC